MPTGGCFCGAVRIEFTGEPEGKVLCHCRDCHKISGSAFSVNMLIPKDAFKVTRGEPKTISKKADSGKSITSYFCGDRGTTIYRLGEWNPGAVILKAGVLDDFDELQTGKPEAELFATTRANWLGDIPGAERKEAMP